MLTDKHLLITGVADDRSIAHATAAAAQRAGATVTLAALPRDLDRATEAAASLPGPVDLIAADLTDPHDLDVLRTAIADRWGRLDGAVHAVAFAPRRALHGPLTRASPDEVAVAFQTSSWSYAALAGIVADLAGPSGAALVGLGFESSAAWPTYSWMGVCKAALESINRYVTRDLGPQRIRSNIVVAGPLHTRAAGGIPGFDLLLDAWEERAPLPWDPTDATPVADAICFLLSDLARAITGTTVRVDGGFHAVAAGGAGGEAEPTLLLDDAVAVTA